MNLPDDAVSEIQLRLPVKSLLRFKCVSKKWCAQINCPLFKKKHLAYRLARYDDECFVKNTEYISGDNAVGIYDDYQSLLSRLKFSPHINFCSQGCTSFCYHINGVVCFARFSGDPDPFSEVGCSIFMCNPALREIEPLSELPGIPPTFCITYPFQTRAVAIGFDDSTEDYVVVMFLHKSGNEDEMKCVSYHVRTESWTMIHMPTCVEDYVSDISNVSSSFFSHGCIHWCLGWRRLILTFNTTSLLFQESIRFPNGWNDYGYKEDAHLFKVDNSCIALVGSHDLHELDVWVMKEYGVAKSWTKQYSVLGLPPIEKPLSFWKRDKLLLQAVDGEILCYDLSRGQLYEPPFGQGDSKRLPNPSMTALKLVTCCGSFVSIKQS